MNYLELRSELFNSYESKIEIELKTVDSKVKMLSIALPHSVQSVVTVRNVAF